MVELRVHRPQRGAFYEVYAPAVTDNGVHLIEIKSHPGEIGGDGTAWQWTTPDGARRSFDNPRLLPNRKAKALRELLTGGRRSPGVAARCLTSARSCSSPTPT
ncbi:MAG: nuclease-related domain-containing protein [Acidimicrobiales bacterium]